MVDLELELLKRKKMRELTRRLAVTPPAPKLKEEEGDPFKILSRYLVGRGREVLEVARTQYPKPTTEIVKELVALIRLGKITVPITGEVLYSIFRALGLRIRLETKIVFEKHGKVKSLSQKLREKIAD